MFLKRRNRYRRNRRNNACNESKASNNRLNSNNVLQKKLHQQRLGTVSQVREITARIMRISKGHRITTIIIGHVTKDGNIARTKSFRTYGRHCSIFRGRRIFFI